MMTPSAWEPLCHRNEKLETILQHQLGLKVRHLRVYQAGQSVVLEGRTETYHTHQLASQIMTTLTPLRVVNDIEVRCW